VPGCLPVLADHQGWRCSLLGCRHRVHLMAAIDRPIDDRLSTD
jgi:hypothetical protein